MATQAIVHFGRRHRDRFATPVLEVGSKLQEGYEQHSPREMHPEGLRPEDWFGIDIEEGAGVDRVVDLCTEEGVLALGADRFGTVHCHCVLEHVPEVAALSR